MEDGPEVTNHSIERMRERRKLPKRAVSRTARLALERGIPVKAYTGSMRRYLDKITITTRNNGKHPKVLVYAESVFVFADGGSVPALITMWPLPKKYRGTKPKGEK